MRHELIERTWRPAVVGALVLLAGITAGCSSPAPLPINQSGAWSTRTLDHSYVTVSVPSGWNVGEAWIQPSSFTDLVGSFSNQSLSPPCTTGANTIGCGLPLQSLQPGAMLVEIWQNGSPDWSLDSVGGAPTTVSGLPARVIDESGGGAGYCSGMGADRNRSAFIPFPTASDNWIEVDICSRGVPAAIGARILASVAVSLPTS
ncbi:MAG TPA: hypothetical protein VND88_05590 [Candidatus Acidoferrales bacterium]|nr:hypothetical protein [Candidatus Acidoferrales bacterium]